MTPVSLKTTEQCNLGRIPTILQQAIPAACWHQHTSVQVNCTKDALILKAQVLVGSSSLAPVKKHKPL